MDLFQDPVTVVVLTPLVTGIIQGLKSEISLINKAPFLASLVTGVVVALLWAFVRDNDLTTALMDGVIVGLTASGFYSGAVRPAKKAVQDRPQTDPA